MFLTNKLFKLLILFIIFDCICQTTANNNKRNELLKRQKRIVGGHASNPPPIDDAVVFTRAFNRISRVQGFRNNQTGIYSFLGVFFAEPPVGRNRFSRPIYKRLDGDINATAHGPPCMQPDPYNAGRIVGSENCLSLNVYTPHMPDESTGSPVVLWIHPGGFRFGSAAQYDATPIAEKGVIVVAPNYRLGSLGIMGDGTRDFNGNLALFDMTAALRWVTEHIEYFGGDPARITPIGQGSGAASAMFLGLSKSARSAGNSSSVMAMSGTAISQYALDKEPVQSVQDIAKINGCISTNKLELIKCMRNKPVEEIINNDSQVQTERFAGRSIIEAMGGDVTFQPHKEEELDNRGLPNIIEYEADEQIESGKFEPIPLLIGTLKHETANAVDGAKIKNNKQAVDKLVADISNSLQKSTNILRLNNSTIQLEEKLAPVFNAFQLPAGLNINEIINKVIESTTDLVFNLPAVLTTHLWSKFSTAFMYSFEYNGTKSSGINFLRGLPVVANSGSGSGNSLKPAHGDELGYLFDANDLFGNPLLETRLTNPQDLKVRSNFISTLVDFVNLDKNKKSKGLLQTITGGATPYLKIDTQLESLTDFPFCGLPLAGKSSNTCSGFAEILAPTTKVLKDIGNTLVNPLGGAIGGLTKLGGSTTAKRDNKNMSYDIFGVGKLG